MKFAFTSEDVVVSIKDLADESEAATLARGFQAVFLIDGLVPEPQLGWVIRDGVLFDPTGSSRSTMMSKLKFLERFTEAELAGIEGFAESGPAPYKFAVRVALRKQAVATFIDIGLAETRQGVLNLVALGLLTSQRADAIINTPVTEIERYKG